MENLLKALNANIVILFECFPRFYDREKYIPEKHIFASFVTRVKDKILLSVNFSLPTPAQSARLWTLSGHQNFRYSISNIKRSNGDDATCMVGLRSVW